MEQRRTVKSSCHGCGQSQASSRLLPPFMSKGIAHAKPQCGQECVVCPGVPVPAGSQSQRASRSSLPLASNIFTLASIPSRVSRELAYLSGQVTLPTRVFLRTSAGRGEVPCTLARQE